MLTDRQLLIQAVNEKAIKLLRDLEPMMLEEGVAYIREHPPEPEVIMTIAFLYRELAYKATQGRSGAWARHDVTKEKLLAFQADFATKRQTDWGWRAAAAQRFNLSTKAIRKILST